MLDRMIGRGRLRRLIVVLPFGFLSQLERSRRQFPDRVLFTDYLVSQLLPAVESLYRVNPRGRVIAGISMGAKQALEAAFAYPRKFRLVGGFSAAIQHTDVLSHLDRFATNPPPVYLRCGRRDGLFTVNGKLVADMAERDFKCNPTTPDGLDGPNRPGQLGSPKDPHLHNWHCWRPALPRFFAAMSGFLG
jgi:S-formylglutathione hydrolase FrmB